MIVPIPGEKGIINPSIRKLIEFNNISTIIFENNINFFTDNNSEQKIIFYKFGIEITA